MANGPAASAAPDDGGPVAVVDIGSGSVKLLIVDEAGLHTAGAERVLVAEKTKLAAGEQHQLSPEALDATADAFERFAALLARHQPGALSIVATAAARDATNAGALHALVERNLGAPLEVLTGQQEAELALAGASGGRDLDGSVAVIDVGAASTEFAVRRADGSTAAWSLPIGGRTLTDLYLHSDPYRPEELSSALTVMELHIDDLKRELPELSAVLETGTVFGVGAVEQIAQVEIGSQDPDYSVDGYRMTKEDLEEVFRVLATESAQDRATNPGLKPHHVDDIVGAMCVLVEFMRQYGVADILISERGLMHGLAADLLAKR